MGLPHVLRRIWRFFHPQWTAMTPKQIKDIDRAVAESMAKGSFTTRQRPTTTPPTADELWIGTDMGSEYAYADGSDGYLPPLPNEPAHLWSMSSHGHASVSSSRGRDSGYAEQRPPSSRKYTPSLHQYHEPYQQWGHDLGPYYFDEQQLQHARLQYPQASYYPDGAFLRAYVPPAGEGDGIVAGQPVNAPF